MCAPVKQAETTYNMLSLHFLGMIWVEGQAPWVVMLVQIALLLSPVQCLRKPINNPPPRLKALKFRRT